MIESKGVLSWWRRTVKCWPISEPFLVWPLTIAVQPDSTTGAEINTLLASEKF